MLMSLQNTCYRELIQHTESSVAQAIVPPDSRPPTPDPGLLLISDRFTDEVVAEKTLEAVRAGVRWVHLRDHRVKQALFAEKARFLVEALRTVLPEIIISVNRRLEVAAELKVSFHTGAKGLEIKTARDKLSEGAIVGYSAHNLEEAVCAFRQGADYIFMSPVFPTKSKPGHAGIGLDRLHEVCEKLPIPVYALGGVSPKRVADCLHAGASGVAVLSGILESPNISDVVGEYILANHQTTIRGC